jgi:hypothetical protein
MTKPDGIVSLKDRPSTPAGTVTGVNGVTARLIVSPAEALVPDERGTLSQTHLLANTSTCALISSGAGLIATPCWMPRSSRSPNARAAEPSFE